MIKPGSLKELAKNSKSRPVRDLLYETLSNHIDVNKYKRNNGIPRTKNEKIVPQNFDDLLGLLKIGANNYLNDSVGAIKDPSTMKDTILALLSSNKVNKFNSPLTKRRMDIGKAGLTNSTLLTALIANQLMNEDDVDNSSQIFYDELGE